MSQQSKRPGRWMLVVPIAFVVMTMVFTWIFTEPLRGVPLASGIVTWILLGLLLSVPFLASLVAMIKGSAAPRIRRAALGYALACGLAGLGMNIAVLTSEGSTAPVGLVVMLVLQVVVALPATVAVTVLVVLSGGRTQRPGVPADSPRS